MELGMVGLGKMGGFMTERLVRGGHRVIGFDRDPAVVQKLAEKGAGSANSLDNIISQLKPPRAIWLMVPAGDPVDQTIAALVPHLSAGDTIIDGGIPTTKILCDGHCARAKENKFRGLRHERRCLRNYGRVQHDGGRRCGCGQASLANFCNAGSRSR
jgi:6-phosphogluconate dehydrogenase (decarboxylating)